MSDLVKRLRNAKESGDPWEAYYLATEAADEIERLRASLRLCVKAFEAQDALKDEIERLRAALQFIVAECDALNKGPVAAMIARAALAGEKKA